MSDIENMQIQRATNASNEVSRLMGRGEYYKGRGDNAQALNNYISALEAYAGYAEAKSEIISVSAVMGSSQGDIISSDTLFELFGLLQFIASCCNSDSIVRAYIDSRLVQIYQWLDQYEKFFDENTLQSYENIGNYVRKIEPNVSTNKERLSTLKPIKEESDEALKIIRKALSKISYTKICPLNLEKSSGCFIATAAYSTPIHPDLDTFRAFRDEKLLTHWIGNKLVKMYYQLSPSVAEYINQKPRIKRFVRRQLESLATWMRNQGITKN
jgi:tetratricopeptide (TPR) repeat protein